MVNISKTACHFLQKLKNFDSPHQHTITIYTDNIVHEYMFGSDSVQTHTDEKGNKITFIPSSAYNNFSIFNVPKIKEIVISKKKWWRFWK